jgi:fructoselysine-6-P-deglycase FrlB-like protein
VTLRVVQEIREQPQVLRSTYPECAHAIAECLGEAPVRGIHLVGCGDMHFAAQAVAELARAHAWDLDVRAWRSMDLRWLHRRLDPLDLVVCASVSGRTPRTVEAARLALGAGARVLGITDNAGSLLHDTVEHCIVLGTASAAELTRDAYAGYRYVLPQTRSYTAVLAAELLVAASRVGEERMVEELPKLFAALISAIEAPAFEVASSYFAGGKQVVVLGSGPHRPIASYGAAKWLEYAVPAAAECLEEFNHLQVFVADSSTRVIALAGDEASRQRVGELTGEWEEVGIASLVLGPDGSFPGDRTRICALPAPDSLLASMVAECVALQYLAVFSAQFLDRDPDRWLGGRRTGLVQGMSQKTIRGSRIWAPRDPTDQTV